RFNTMRPARLGIPSRIFCRRCSGSLRPALSSSPTDETCDRDPFQLGLKRAAQPPGASAFSASCPDSGPGWLSAGLFHLATASGPTAARRGPDKPILAVFAVGLPANYDATSPSGGTGAREQKPCTQGRLRL